MALLLFSLASIQAEELPSQVQAELLTAIENWNNFYGSSVKARNWEYEGKIDSEGERRQIILEMTRPENAWFPDGDISEPDKVAAKQLGGYDESTDDASIAEWKEMIGQMVHVGHHVVRIMWKQDTANSEFSTICITDDETIVYDSMLFNIVLVEEHSRCLDLSIYWLWGRTRGRIIADLSAVCDGPVARACSHNCSGWCTLGKAECMCKVTQYVDHCSLEYNWAWAVGFRSVEIQKDGFTLKVKGYIGSYGKGNGSCVDFCAVIYTAYDPPIWDNIMIYPIPEHIFGSDLNGDDDIDDTILCYQNLETQEIVNTALMVSDASHLDIYKNIAVFVGENSRIQYYDIATGIAGETGAIGIHPSIHGNIIAFVSEDTIGYFDLDTGRVVDTGIPGDSPAIYKDTIAFHATQSSTIWIYDLHTGATVDTGIIGMNPALYENIVAFETSEPHILDDLNGDGDASDKIIRYYDLETEILLNTGAVGVFPALYGDRIAFATPEEDVNKDLNGDGKFLGSVICYYDLKTGQTVNTKKLGTKPDIYENTISFSLWEHWISRDLNSDGDLGDLLMDTYQITATKTSTADLVAGLLFAISVIGGISLYSKRKK